MKRLGRSMLKTYRSAHGLTQQALADKIGVHRVTVANWEIGLYPIPQWLGVVVQAFEPKQKKGGG